MRISGRSNTAHELYAAIAKFGRDKRFWDGKTGMLFDASPCETCGTMSAHGNAIELTDLPTCVHRSLEKVFSTKVPYVECIGFNDDGEEECENCGEEGTVWLP